MTQKQGWWAKLTAKYKTLPKPLQYAIPAFVVIVLLAILFGEPAKAQQETGFKLYGPGGELTCPAGDGSRAVLTCKGTDGPVTGLTVYCKPQTEYQEADGVAWSCHTDRSQLPE